MSAFRRLVAGMCAAIVVIAGTAAADEPRPSSRSSGLPFAAHLSPGDDASEYWDVIAWFDSGERFFARFLITNQGPGDRTAAAFGHVLLADGRVLPFQWGRSSDQWTLGPKGQSLKIAKARLDVSGPAMVASVSSTKHGVVARVEIGPPPGIGRTDELETGYDVDFAFPAPAHGTIEIDGESRAVTGSGAIVHTSLQRPEGQMIRRRDDLVARSGDDAVYLASVVGLDGARRTFVAAAGRELRVLQAPLPTLVLGKTTTSGDPRYPVATDWKTSAYGRPYAVTLRKELLRMNPLEILPQPFRFLLSLGGAPQRVWTNATVVVGAKGKDAATTLDGIAVSTFGAPER